eukprot:TRINITY_DN4086_c0_g2_i1.p1 TRINITY_DN4086_c0_g2~~TRINITY_DN4086_c0_g2_i1.p1  ORF type:complete len:209 (-),score=41.60 TRINITY_DN4086_c0_g2_i1:343-969(-)
MLRRREKYIVFLHNRYSREFWETIKKYCKNDVEERNLVDKNLSEYLKDLRNLPDNLKLVVIFGPETQSGDIFAPHLEHFRPFEKSLFVVFALRNQNAVIRWKDSKTKFIDLGLSELCVKERCFTEKENYFNHLISFLGGGNFLYWSFQQRWNFLAFGVVLGVAGLYYYFVKNKNELLTERSNRTQTIINYENLNHEKNEIIAGLKKAP